MAWLKNAATFLMLHNNFCERIFVLGSPHCPGCGFKSFQPFDICERGERQHLSALCSVSSSSLS